MANDAWGATVEQLRAEIAQLRGEIWALQRRLTDSVVEARRGQTDLYSQLLKRISDEHSRVTDEVGELRRELIPLRRAAARGRRAS